MGRNVIKFKDKDDQVYDVKDTKAREDISGLKSAIKSTAQADNIYHLGFYIDADGDLCQLDA